METPCKILRTRALLVLPAALCITAWGAETVDTAKAERVIRKKVEKRIGATVKSVKCPKDVRAKEGSTFTCTVIGADRTKGKAKVVQKDDKGNVRISAPFIHVRKLERLLGSDISRQVEARVTVRCPEIITARKGDTFYCRASDGKNTAKVKVIQKDDQGNVRFKLLQR